MNITYNVVQLIAALNLDTDQQSISHSEMTAIIRYRTPYLVYNRDILFIYFALGNNSSLHCVLQLPTLLTLGGSTDLVKGEILYSEINRNFPLTLDSPSKGLSKRIHGLLSCIKSNAFPYALYICWWLCSF